MDMGTGMKNTARQSNTVIISPPKAGPTTAPAPMALMCAPRPLPRSFAGNREATKAIPIPWIMAAPQP